LLAENLPPRNGRAVFQKEKIDRPRARHSSFPLLINIRIKFMFKELNGFLGVMMLLLVLRWALPEEISALAGEILVKVLTIIRDLITQAQI
jgi:hypothetical protein